MRLNKKDRVQDRPIGSENKVVHPPNSIFALTFMFMVISAAGLVALMPPSYLAAAREVTATLTEFLGSLIGLSVSSSGDIVTINGFAMRIIDQCTAVDYVTILGAAILLYTRHRLSYRLFGLAVAIPIILLANAMRLVISGVVGSYSRSAFDFVHDYLWVVGFALIVFALWSLWVNGRFDLTRGAACRMAVVASVSIATYLLLFLFQTAYSGLLARTTALIYGLLYDDPLGRIIHVGSGVAYVREGSSLFLSSYMEQLNIAVYVGMMAPLQKREDWEMAATTLMGLVVIFLIGSLFIAVGCGFGVASGEGRLVEFLEAGSFVQLALPMTVYWVLSSERDKRDARFGTAA